MQIIVSQPALTVLGSPTQDPYW